MNKRLKVISVVVWMLLLLAAAISATHIVETARKLGLHDWQAFTTPALIDLVAIVGKVSMAQCFSRAFRRSGFRLLMVGATLSLGCNVYAGENIGERAFGVLVVGAFMLLEHHATKADRTAMVDPTVDEATKAKRAEAARKAAETRKRNAAKRTRKPRAPRTVTTVTAAPVSPGMPPLDLERV